MLRTQLTVQPRFGEAPFALHGARRSTNHARGLFHGEAGEEPQLDDPHLFRIEGGQPLAGPMTSRNVLVVAVVDAKLLVLENKPPGWLGDLNLA
jgi:hypothetical protein